MKSCLLCGQIRLSCKSDSKRPLNRGGEPHLKRCAQIFNDFLVEIFKRWFFVEPRQSAVTYEWIATKFSERIK